MSGPNLRNIALQVERPLAPLVLVDCSIPEAPPNGAIIKVHYPGVCVKVFMIWLMHKCERIPEFEITSGRYGTSVFIQVHYTGICGTDVYIWSDRIKVNDTESVSMQQFNPKFKLPYIMGHEICGEIESLGLDAGASGSNLSVGERVIVYPWAGCGSCGACQKEENNMCDHSITCGTGLGDAPGGYQRYFAISDVKHLIKIPPSISSDVACMFGCSVLTAYNACIRAKNSIERAVRLRGEAIFLIVGLGGLGMWAVKLAKAIYPDNTKLIVADGSAIKLQIARECGADEAVLWPREGKHDEFVTETQTVCGGSRGGIDGCVDFVGTTSTVQCCFSLARKGATLVMVGLAGGTLNGVSLSQLILKEITLSGLCVGSKRQVEELVELYSKKQITPPPTIEVKPEDVADALQRLKDGNIHGRAIINFSSFENRL